MTPSGCADSRLSLGAYVLGALDSAERGRVETHLAGCADCRDELASMAALPGLLGRVSLAEVAAEPELAGPSLLNRVLAAAALERRRETRTRWLVAAAAGVVVVASATVAGVALATSDHSPGDGSTPAALTVSATDPTTHITATVVEWGKSWGSALQVKVTGETSGAYDGRCQLVAISSTGERDVAASWTATPSGEITASGATGFAPSDIASFKIIRADGDTLVTVPVAAART